MRYFLDTEFIERPGTIELISLGLVTDDRRSYYAQSCEFDANQANPWVQAHVLPQLEPCPRSKTSDWHRDVPREEEHLGCYWQTRDEIRADVLAFVGDDIPEFWGYYASYDWVVFCWLFGAMIQLPKGWPMYVYDLRQWLDHRGLSHIKQPDDMPHHALSDAFWVAETYRRYVHQ